MTDRRFRLLLLVYIALSLGAVTASFAPNMISPELAKAYAQQPAPWISNHTWLAFIITFPLLVANIVGIVGLYRFKRWGRSLSLWTTVLAFLFYLSPAPTLSSALEGALVHASTLAWGAILALAYFSPVAARLSANNSFKPEPLRGSA